jgi:2-keto-4-pentenoate hydratase/2-oxohepta-3-ene-1,7-dioic acid hydratase in catechol pathway
VQPSTWWSRSFAPRCWLLIPAAFTSIGARQQDRTSRIISSFRKIINYISTFTTLVPGDLIIAGAPTAAARALTHRLWLQPGDVVEIEADGLGNLRNNIADEA